MPPRRSVPRPLLLALLTAMWPLWAQHAPDARERLLQGLQVSASSPADPCEDLTSYSPDKAATEEATFEAVGELVSDALNQAKGGDTPRRIAEREIQQLEAQSSTVNAAWPTENRFHAEAMEITPILVLRMSFRFAERYRVLANTPTENHGLSSWHDVGSDDIAYEYPSPRSKLQLWPLPRGESGNPRFLSQIVYFGCAGSLGLEYDGEDGAVPHWRAP